MVNTILRHLNEKIDRKLHIIHSLYSLLFEDIKNFDRDQEVAAPLSGKWVHRANELKMMFMASKFHADKPQEIQPTYFLVKSLHEF